MSEFDMKFAKEKLAKQQVTSWLKVGSAFGPTSFNATSNEGWCCEEVWRLNAKGVPACSVIVNGYVAVFRLCGRDTRKSLVELVEKVGIEVEE